LLQTTVKYHVVAVGRELSVKRAMSLANISDLMSISLCCNKGPRELSTHNEKRTGKTKHPCFNPTGYWT